MLHLSKNGLPNSIHDRKRNMLSDYDLTGKTALVTVAAGGLGAKIATTLELAEARVFATDRDGAALAKLKSASCAGWDTRVLDVSDIEEIARVVGSVANEAGRIDNLVNCAGIYRMQFLSDMTEADWDLLISVNLKGAAFMIKAVARQLMTKGNAGSIVNVASAVGRRATAGSIAYSSSKAGVISLTQGAASELAGSGIRVNAIAPDAVETEMWEQMQRDYSGKLPPEGPTVETFS